MSTYFDLVKAATSALSDGGVNNARGEASQLLMHAFGMTIEKYASVKNDDAPEEGKERLAEYLARRLRGEPLQYIVESWDFCGLTFKVTPECLVPRFDTETLVHVAAGGARRFRESGVFFADMCSGSGCIAVSIAKLLPDSQGLLLEKSDGAIAVSRENISAHGESNRLRTVSFDVFTDTLPDGVNLLVSNPPYLTSDDMDHLSSEVRYEPEMALFGGDDGLDFYRAICQRHVPRLVNGAYVAFEIGAGQADDVTDIMKQNAVGNIKTYCDTSGIVRVAAGYKLAL